MKADSELYYANNGKTKVVLLANCMHSAKREVFGMRGNVTITRNGKILAKREKGKWRHINADV
jgi:hypothetical protein